jgi:hypothetical protein
MKIIPSVTVRLTHKTNQPATETPISTGFPSDWSRKKGMAMEKNRIDALDLIINALEEHEKNLDNLLNRLDTLLETLSNLLARLEYIYKKIERTS